MIKNETSDLLPFTIIIKEQIDHFCKNIMENHPLIKNTRLGLIGRMEVGVYLLNILNLISKTPEHIVNAEKKSRQLEQQILVEFYRHKLPEEQGHHEWAISDITSLRFSPAETARLSVCPSMKKIITTLDELTTTHPLAYLVYQYFAEATTVKVAPAWIKDLETYGRIPPSSLSVLTKHVEADTLHSMEDLQFIDRCVRELSAEKNSEKQKINQQEIVQCHEYLKFFMFNFHHFLLRSCRWQGPCRCLRWNN